MIKLSNRQQWLSTSSAPLRNADAFRFIDFSTPTNALWRMICFQFSIRRKLTLTINDNQTPLVRGKRR